MPEPTPPRHEAPWHSHGDLACDEFRRDASYRNYRSRGGGDWLMIYTAAGEGSILPGSDLELRVRPGDCLIWEPGETQEYNTALTAPGEGYWHIFWAHFLPKPDWAPWLRWPRSAGSRGVRLLHLPAGELRESFASALQRMLTLYRREVPGREQLAQNALEEALLWGQAVLSGSGWARLDPRVRKAMDLLGAGLSRPFDLEALAAGCGLSISRLAHLFRRETGTTPQHYQEQLRMRQARQLLRLTNLSIAEIATELGYQDAFYFSKRFRRAENLSPSEFRRKLTPL